MAAKSKPKTKSKEKGSCDLCCDTLKSSDEVLVCEGSCQKQMHRYCAGVNKTLYEMMIEKGYTFVCMPCTQAVYKAMVQSMQDEITQLKEEVASLKSLCHQSTAASDQADLKDSETLIALHKDVLNQVLKNNALSYADALAGKCFNLEEDKEMTTRPKNQMAWSTAAPKHVPKERISVIGARKIWGTLRSTTVTTVTRALETVTDLPIDQLSVKRKYKNMINSKKSVRWWFVIRGDEGNLQKLEECWHAVGQSAN